MERDLPQRIAAVGGITCRKFFWSWFLSIKTRNTVSKSQLEIPYANFQEKINILFVQSYKTLRYGL